MDRGIVNNDKTGPGTDGNNGCGNDPDREDDNNGWCGKPPIAEVQPAGIRSGTVVSARVQPAGVPGVQVLGASFDRPSSEVQGLAVTAADLLRVAMTAGALVIVGLGIRRMGSPRSM
jgi:hypothetical protein